MDVKHATCYIKSVAFYQLIGSNKKHLGDESYEMQITNLPQSDSFQVSDSDCIQVFRIFQQHVYYCSVSLGYLCKAIFIFSA